MSSKSVVIFILVSFAVTYGAKLSTNENTEIVSTEREGRIDGSIVGIPIVGLLIWKFTKISWFLLLKVVKFIGWKLAAVTLVATVAYKLVSWAYNNCFSIALTIAMYGFCRITGICFPSHIPTGLAAVGNHLYYAAKNLNSGIALYDNSI